MKKFIASALSVLAFNAAAIEIEDQDDVLERIASYNPGVTFESAMQCGLQYDVTAQDGECNVRCDAHSCMSMCSPAALPKFKIAVEDCSADKAYIYGENGMSLEVTRADFVKGGNTILLPFLQ